MMRQKTSSRTLLDTLTASALIGCYHLQEPGCVYMCVAILRRTKSLRPQKPKGSGDVTVRNAPANHSFALT